ncbi:MAG: NAD(P)/FAD-dependent oxidoreductase [Bacteroidota bacterium]
MGKSYDLVIIGSGPNGLSAGIYLAQAGYQVLILEAAESVGGGMRTAELSIPGFHHDVCSAVHPTGYLSPYFKELELEKYGLEWVFPEASVAHPLDDGPAVLLSKSVEETAIRLGRDAKAYKRLIGPIANNIEGLLADSLGPLSFPKDPINFVRFGMRAGLPANFLSKLVFKEEAARALFAGCAAHSILPFSKLFTAALGVVFLATGHAVDWPMPKGGSQSLANALLACFEKAGGSIEFGKRIKNFSELPEAKAYIFDTDPFQLAHICKDHLPSSYKNKLLRYHFGPGVFKIDYALKEPIPWKDPNCLKASTIHVGGTLEEIAQGEKEAWEGKISQSPYVLMAQQSQFDPTRAPEGQHTCWAYCHVPFGSTVDMSEIIENQIERFAPGFRDVILAKSSMNSPAFEAYNPNYVGGAVTGGAADITQLFTRPVGLINPYSTPNEKIFICSASTPPGGGVHGMNGYHAAKAVEKQLKKGIKA